MASLAPRKLLDLRTSGAIRLGIPTDVVRGRAQQAGRKFSQQLYDGTDFDGIVYMSRIANAECVAIYDRAVPSKLDPACPLPCRSAPYQRTGIGAAIAQRASQALAIRQAVHEITGPLRCRPNVQPIPPSRMISDTLLPICRSITARHGTKIKSRDRSTRTCRPLVISTARSSRPNPTSRSGIE
jgi:hypothetical protein